MPIAAKRSLVMDIVLAKCRQPLRPVVAMPSISSRWKNRKKAKTGSSVSDRHREQRAPVRLAGRVDEAAQAELHRVVAHVVEIDQRAEEIVPGPDEGEDRGRRQRRQRQRQDDLPVDAPRAAAVDHRGLVELARDGAEELHQQEDEERVGGEEFRHDQRQEGVRPSRGCRNSTYCGIRVT